MVSLPLSLSVCVCVCVCARACVCARGWAGTCAGGVRFSNSNRIIPSDYRILHLLKMPIPTVYSTSWNRCFTKASNRTFCSRWGLTDQINDLKKFNWNRPLSILVHFRISFHRCSSGASDQYLKDLERISDHGDLSSVYSLKGERGIQILRILSKWVFCHSLKLLLDLVPALL